MHTTPWVRWSTPAANSAKPKAVSNRHLQWQVRNWRVLYKPCTEWEGQRQEQRLHKRGSTIGEGGDTTISSPGRSPKRPFPGMGLHDPLHGRQACPKFIAFDQGVGQICPRSGLFSCRSLPKRGQICYTPPPPYR